MITNFKDMGDHLLNGAKNVDFKCPFADIAVVWAKNEEGRIHGLIVERGMEGFTTPETHNKWSLRASSTGELIFDNVKVPKENLLPNKSGFGTTWMFRFSTLRNRLGSYCAAMDCYDTALRYAKERIQFDKPIAGTQLQQKKLADYRNHKSTITNMEIGCFKNEGRATTQISMPKETMSTWQLTLHVKQDKY
jgi:glutaryl-CoA dehydrogenase